ncbi:MAG: LCP family protein [Chloroflexota bacterium]
MGKKKLLLVIVIVICVIVGVYLVPKAVNLWRNWNKPLGLSLGLPSLTPTSIETTIPGEVTPVTQNTLTPTPAPLCGGPSTMVVLGIGDGARGDDYTYGIADVIRIVRVDFVTPKVTVLAIPRDLWVQIPDISEHYGITAGKLNQAYFYGNPGNGYYDGPGEGPGLLASTLDLNFGLRVDHYGAVNMVTFAKIVDALGGIDIYLPESVDGHPVDDTTGDMGYFSAGYHHLSGIEALNLSRIRKKYTEFKRIDNQTMVLCAIRKKVLSPSVLPAIPGIISSFQNSVQTDLSPAQINQLLCLVPKVSRENIIFASLPQEYLTPSSIYDPQLGAYTFIWQRDDEKILTTINDFLNGDWPIPAVDDTPSCPEVGAP